jgi:RpiR family transcriptional regulator, carbohydrate utilization regulator
VSERRRSRADGRSRAAAAPAFEPLPHVVARLRAALPSLRASEAKVIRTTLEKPEKVLGWTVSELAAAAGTSAATVVRALRGLGFQGYQHFRICLAQDLVPSDRLVSGDLSPEISTPDLLANVTGLAATALREVRSTLDESQFDRAVAAVSAADTIVFVGIGTSAPIAQDAAYRFLTIGINAIAPPDSHVQHLSSKLLTSSDVAVAVSHSGSTRETVECVEAARGQGATTIAVTSFASSPLVAASDIALVGGGPGVSFMLDSMASRIVHLAILDALFVATALRDPEATARALDAVSDVASAHRL